MQLRNIDAQALANLNRALIGFDRLFSDVETRYANSVQTNYPPYNILKHDENNFEIEIAVAGFSKKEITVEVDQNLLVVRGASMTTSWPTETYLHRGLAARDFERSWTLAEHMEVSEVELTDGILRVKITRIVPEELKPRLIPIK